MRQRNGKATAWTLLLVMLALCLPTFAAAEDAAPNPKDDFYTAVNAQWLSTAQIAPDRYSAGGFDDLAYEVLYLLMADADKMVAGEITPDNAMLAEFAAFYAMAADYETRNADGAAPLAPYLARIDALDGLEALGTDLSGWLLDDMPLPFSLAVIADMANAQQNSLYALAPSLMLPDVSYYDPANPYGPMLLEALSGVAAQLLALAGYGEEDAARITQEALAFDALIVPYAKTAEESSDVRNSYNPQAFSDFCASSDALDFAALADELTGRTPEQIIVVDPGYFAAFNEIVSEENFALLKSWMTVQTMFATGGYLSQDMQAVANSFSDMMTGRAEPASNELLAYSTAASLFGPVVGDYYGRAYFGEAAKADVTGMVESIIAVYKSRLTNNGWLSAETKAAAIRKLDAMSIQVGYPDSIDPLYEKMTVTPAADGGTLLSNAMAFARLANEDMFAKIDQPVDRNEWMLTADTVNAMYYLMGNTIMFPAAILQAPFYSPEQSKSANYGGIGAVIAHEISHAFDPNGSLFDEYGSFSDWWAEEDLAQFEALSQGMVALFDGLPHAGGTINGQLTVGENVADAGGLSCALEITQGLPDADLAAFFTNWATIWRVLYTPQIEQLLLTMDSHAPNMLRVNMQLPLLDAFYETFDIQEGDGMYIAPEARVSIW